jgi:hypothetical protein
MKFGRKVFGAKMTTAKYAVSVCANRGLVAVLDITAPNTHGDLSWSTAVKKYRNDGL